MTGLLPDPLGSYSALPNSLAVIGSVRNRFEIAGRELHEGVGRKGKGRIVID